MKKIKFIAMLFIATLVFVSCQNEDVTETEAVSTQKYPEIASKLQKMHFSAEGLEIVDLELPDGTKQKRFKVEGDMIFSKEQIENAKVFTDVKQYRASTIVRVPWWGGIRVLKIIGYTGGRNALSSKERVALRWAVNNYNALNLRIKFALTYGTNYGPQDIVVYRRPNFGVGGRSGFPFNGNPYKWVSVWGLSAYSYNYCECVFTHLIGHTIGMHHTNPGVVSCNGFSTSTLGAIHIPGTPVGADPNSVFNACCPISTTGEFSYYDKVALNFLY